MHDCVERTKAAISYNVVSLYRTCSVGINLHKACHDVMMLEPAINANTILQAIGRVHRLGQKERQEIDILFVDHTFNRQVEHNQAKKMISQIVRQGKGVFGEVIQRSKDVADTAANGENEGSDGEEDKDVEAEEMKIARKEGDSILQKMLGQSRSHLEWDNPKDQGFSSTTTREKAQNHTKSEHLARSHQDQNVGQGAFGAVLPAFPGQRLLSLLVQVFKNHVAEGHVDMGSANSKWAGLKRRVDLQQSLRDAVLSKLNMLDRTLEILPEWREDKEGFAIA